ncbi:MAG TPA: carboxypeptidase-like regulatory domain-containing protein, partial [Pyrinomonadaceae bacterium]|nr:carboxypeptidase-like regulatory domain-containing protein [Pyrinomonadaceae bacterium]
MNKARWRVPLVLLAALVLAHAVAPAGAAATPAGSRRLGTVAGSVRDSRGNPLAGAVVTLLREGAGEVVKQLKSAADGSFLARVAPGKYVLRAVADGFNEATFSSVQVNASDELVYRFNLERAGQGRTSAERRPDRNDPKFRLRGNQARRSIFQIDEEADPTVAAAEAAVNDEQKSATEGDEVYARRAGGEGESRIQWRPRGVVETFFTSAAGERGGEGFGLNFAVANPVSERLDLLFVGQTGALDRLEATARVRAGDRHRLNLTLGGARLPMLLVEDENLLDPREALGQFSVRAVDEWVVRDGVVLVVGLDYARFLGASDADSWSPRLGVQYDVNARTRVRAAYAPGGRESRVQSATMFEDVPVTFYEQTDEPVAFVDGNAVMERTRRLEFGVERVLDGSATLEATAFIDTTDGRGVGLMGSPLAALSGEQGAALLSVANQQGAARGLRVVYTRRISNSLRASAGYAFGRGQQLSADGITNPEDIFRSGFFQTAAAQFDADLADGTRVRTVLRFSPRAAVFAIDPFAGRLAV